MKNSKDTETFHKELFEVEDDLMTFIQKNKESFVVLEKSNPIIKIIDFFKENPNPPDSKIHALADKFGIEHDKFEAIIYSILSDLIEHGSDAKNVDTKELKSGIKIESEHTVHPELAKFIALAHLKEIPNYYTLLSKMEKEAKKNG